MEATGLFSLDTIEQYGLPLILLLGAIYALVRITMWSLGTVKSEFTRYHISHAEAIAKMQIDIAEMRTQQNLLVAFIKKESDR
jgi:hypothetical protein